MTARWQVLAIYAAASALMQFEWLRFAPLTDAVAAQYGVSAGAVGSLSLVFPLLFLPLALPSGALVDRLRVRSALRIAIAVMLLGGLVRLLMPGFNGLLASQCVMALVQPLLMSLVGRLVQVWFPPDQQLHATGLATMALFAGLGLAFVLVPLLSPDHVAGGLWIDTLALAVLAIAGMRIPADPPAPPVAINANAPGWFRALGSLLKTPPFGAILLLIFIANGFFNAVFTWLEPLLRPQGIDARHAGLIGLLILIGGVASMALIGRLGSSVPMVRRVILAVAVAELPLILMLFVGVPYPLLCVTAFLMGVLALGPLPLLIELVGTLAGPRLAGTAVSAFWLAGNAGAAVVIAALSPIADAQAWTLAGFLFAALSLVEALIGATLLRQKAVAISA